MSMSDLGLIFAVYRRHKTRTLFTVLSVAVAFAILLVLTALSHGITGLTSNAQAQRLVIIGKSSNTPVNYAAKIATVAGVVAVDYQAGFAGWVGDQRHWVYAMGVPFAAHMRVHPELHVSNGEYRAMQTDRQGAVAGAALARKMGWKIGDIVRIQGGPPQMGGNPTWSFRLDGIFTSTLPDSTQQYLAVHYDYVNEGRADIFNRDKIDNIFVLADDARHISRIARAIDERFAHSQPNTQTFPEQLLTAAVVKSFGDVGAILTAIAAAVFASMLLVVGNTMAGSVRERMNEFAMMRALGFTRRRLARQVLGEATLMIGIGAALGVFLGWQICTALAPTISQVAPYFMVTWQALALALALAVGFSLLTGLLPARRVTRLDIARALRRI
jgi:putative ABC transport system permease protein